MFISVLVVSVLLTTIFLSVLVVSVLLQTVFVSGRHVVVVNDTDKCIVYHR